MTESDERYPPVSEGGVFLAELLLCPRSNVFFFVEGGQPVLSTSMLNVQKSAQCDSV